MLPCMNIELKIVRIVGGVFVDADLIDALAEDLRSCCAVGAEERVARIARMADLVGDRAVMHDAAVARAAEDPALLQHEVDDDVDRDQRDRDDTPSAP